MPAARRASARDVAPAAVRLAGTTLEASMAAKLTSGCTSTIRHERGDRT